MGGGALGLESYLADVAGNSENGVALAMATAANSSDAAVAGGRTKEADSREIDTLVGEYQAALAAVLAAGSALSAVRSRSQGAVGEGGGMAKKEEGGERVEKKRRSSKVVLAAVDKPEKTKERDVEREKEKERRDREDRNRERERMKAKDRDDKDDKDASQETEEDRANRRLAQKQQAARVASYLTALAESKRNEDEVKYQTIIYWLLF